MRKHSFILGRRQGQSAWFCTDPKCNQILPAAENPDEHLSGCPMTKAEPILPPLPPKSESRGPVDGLLEGVPRFWQHANHNAGHPETTVFECRQVNDNGTPLGHIECRAIIGNSVSPEVKVFKTVAALKENWNW